MLTPTLARDLIFRIPKCQMDTLSLASWRCGDLDGSHPHTVFGNRIVRDSKVVLKTDGDCKTSLQTVLMKEANCKEAISMEDWTCFDTKYKRCYVHDEDTCKQCGMDKLGRCMAIIDGWTQLAATQCIAPKDGTFEEKPLVDIIATIISPHHRSYTGLCFPNAWDPTRPLKLENNDEDRLNNYYSVPVACDCNYEIPMLKGLPKAKKDKSADDKNVKKSKTDKTKDADKTKDTTKNRIKSSSSKNADSAESSNKNKNSKTRKSHKNTKE